MAQLRHRTSPTYVTGDNGYIQRGLWHELEACLGASVQRMVRVGCLHLILYIVQYTYIYINIIIYVYVIYIYSDSICSYRISGYLHISRKNVAGSSRLKNSWVWQKHGATTVPKDYHDVPITLW